MSETQIDAIEKSQRGEDYVVRCLIKTLRHQQSLGGLDDAPPHDVQLESEALSSVLVGETQHAGIVLTGLTVEDFYVPQHQDLFRAMQDGWNRDVKWGTVGALTDWLKRTGTLKDPERREMAITAARAILKNGLAHYAAYYVERLTELRQRRELVDFAKTVVQVGGDRSRNLDDIRAQFPGR